MVKELPPARILRLQPDDVVVIEGVDDDVTPEQYEGLQAIFPDNRLLLLANGKTVKVVRPDHLPTD